MVGGRSKRVAWRFGVRRAYSAPMIPTRPPRRAAWTREAERDRRCAARRATHRVDRAHVPAGARGIALEERVAVQPDARTPSAHGAREIAPRAVQLGRHLDHPRRVAVRRNREGTEILGSTYMAPWRWSSPGRPAPRAAPPIRAVGMQMPRPGSAATCGRFWISAKTPSPCGEEHRGLPVAVQDRLHLREGRLFGNRDAARRPLARALHAGAVGLQGRRSGRVPAARVPLPLRMGWGRAAPREVRRPAPGRLDAGRRDAERRPDSECPAGRGPRGPESRGTEATGPSRGARPRTRCRGRCFRSRARAPRPAGAAGSSSSGGIRVPYCGCSRVAGASEVRPGADSAALAGRPAAGARVRTDGPRGRRRRALAPAAAWVSSSCGNVLIAGSVRVARLRGVSGAAHADRAWRASSLRALPSARPWARAVTSFMTRPRSLGEEAPIPGPASTRLFVSSG